MIIGITNDQNSLKIDSSWQDFSNRKRKFLYDFQSKRFSKKRKLIGKFFERGVSENSIATKLILWGQPQVSNDFSPFSQSPSPSIVKIQQLLPTEEKCNRNLKIMNSEIVTAKNIDSKRRNNDNLSFKKSSIRFGGRK